MNKPIIFPLPESKKRLLKELMHQFPAESQQLLAAYAEVPNSTLALWKEGPRQIEAALRLLERMKPGDRQKLLDRFCRYPASLDDHVLRYEGVAVGKLRATVQKNRGATIIRSNFLNERLFLAFALGHELQAVRPGRIIFQGIWAAGLEIFTPVYSMTKGRKMVVADLDALLGTSPSARDPVFLVEAIQTPLPVVDLMKRLSADRHVIISCVAKIAEALQSCDLPHLDVIEASSMDETALRIKFRTTE